MIFDATALPGVWVVRPEPFEDERGSFARTFCEEEFRDHGIDPHVAQCSLSRNPKPGTLRGLHLQREPYGETKTVRCTRGEIFDVAVDLRPESPTFGRHHSVHLSGENGLALVMPPGVAHGFVSRVADSEVWYQMSVPYAPDAATGVRWDDPALGIAWPISRPVVLSERDAALPTFAHLRAGAAYRKSMPKMPAPPGRPT
jgi:dTDP-4-dehydrorhamnose 3,5-epimerase